MSGGPSRLRRAVVGQVALMCLLLLIGAHFDAVRRAQGSSHPQINSHVLFFVLIVLSAVGQSYRMALHREWQVLAVIRRQGQPETQARYHSLVAAVTVGALFGLYGAVTVGVLGWAWGVLVYALALPFWLHIYLQWRRNQRLQGAS